MKESHNYDHSHNHELEEIPLLSNILFAKLGFAIFQLIILVFSGSITIFTSFINDIGDIITLYTTIFIEKYSSKQRSRKYTYGYRRFSLVSAIINITLIVVGCFVIINTSIDRLSNPIDVQPLGIMVVGLLGVILNVIIVKKLSKSSSIACKSLALNIKGDVYNYIALIIGGCVMIIFGTFLIDIFLAIGIAIVMLKSSYEILKNIFGILMQSTPKDIDIELIEKQILEHTHITDVHDIHVWSLDGEDYILTAHIVVEDDTSIEEIMEIKDDIKLFLETQHINHTTLEFDDIKTAIKHGEYKY